MPRKIGPRAGKKRTKTFSGCWTCRARGVKCDTVQPSCDRCRKAKRVCEGYGIRLTWDRQSNSEEKPLKGRLMFSESDMIHPTFTEEEIDLALELLDVGEIEQSCQAGPFIVFKSSVSVHEINQKIQAEETNWSDSIYALASPDIISQVWISPLASTFIRRVVDSDFSPHHAFHKSLTTSACNLLTLLARQVVSRIH